MGKPYSKEIEISFRKDPDFNQKHIVKIPEELEGKVYDVSMLDRTINWLNPKIGVNKIKLVQDDNGLYWFNLEKSQYLSTSMLICSRDFTEGKGHKSPLGWLCKITVEVLYPELMDGKHFRVFVNGKERTATHEHR